MTKGHRRHILDIVATDATFVASDGPSGRCWVGKCLFCNTRIVVWPDGETAATVEHILSRHHGGDDDLRNLALACGRCNGEKGRRHDNRRADDPRAREVVAALLERRRARWREPG